MWMTSLVISIVVIVVSIGLLAIAVVLCNPRDDGE